MSLLGVHMTLMVGPGAVATPAPPDLVQAIEEVKITHSDEGRSGFQITFRTGRSGPEGLIDYPLLGGGAAMLLKAFNRVVVIATFGVVPRSIMDGIITRAELQPGDGPGRAKVVVTGEDVSVMMDLHERSAEHPAQDETIIATKIIATYAQYGLVPMVIPPRVIDPPIPIERTPVQQGTDLDYLEQMAQRHGYVFYVSPGPAPLVNTAYWGPPLRVGAPQRAITVNMGAETNAILGAFQANAMGPTSVEGSVQDRTTNQSLPVRSAPPLRPPLAAMPAWLVNQPNTRSRQFRESGVNAAQAFARAQGTTDASADAVTVDGELDAARYGGLLEARGLVGVRGAGYQHDGLWYVKRVTHEIRPGSYKQGFSLAREGHGSTTPAVIP
jgi:hypothetical protein